MTFPNAADISSAQGSFDAGAYAASGRQAVIIKSTEGTGYHFAGGDAWEQAGLAHGLVVVRYHFAGDSMHGVIHDPAAEGDYFLRFNGDHTPGRAACCDIESPLRGPALYGLSPAAAAQWTSEFLDHIAAQGGWPGIGYSFSGDGVIQRLKAGYLRWYAAYPGPVPLDANLHQFTDRGPVPGVGNCDDSHVYVDLRAFAGASVPAHPKLQEDDMAVRIPTPDPQRSKQDPAGYTSPDGKLSVPANSLYECGSLRLYGKGLATVTTDQYPTNANGALCRIAIGSAVDGWGVEYKWIGNFPWEVPYDTTAMKGRAELAVTVYGQTAAPVTLSSFQTG